MCPSKFIQTTALVALVTLGAQGVALAKSRPIDQSGRSKIVQLVNAQTSLIQAIKIAEKNNSGKVYSINGKTNKGSLYYEIVGSRNGRTKFIKLDPATGRILSTKTRNLVGRLFNREEDGEMSGRVKAVHVNLIKAVQTAERRVGGSAIEAHIKESDGPNITILVEVFKNGNVKKVYLDGVSNTIIKASAPRSRAGEDN